MNSEQFYGTELVNKIKELMIYSKHATQEERTILSDSLREAASRQTKNIVQIVLIKLAEYVESLEVCE